MIISHQYRFIFLKTRKTGGTSIEVELSKHCGPADILTALRYADEAERFMTTGSTARNFVFSGLPSPESDEPDEIIRHFKKNREIPERKMVFRYHTTGMVVKEMVGNHIWNSYFKFTIERDVCQQIQSLYTWRRWLGHAPDEFRKFLESGMPQKERNSDIYMHNDELLVDYIIDYASLEEDFTLVCRYLGIPFDGGLPHLKSRPDEGVIIDMDDEVISKIIHDFKREHTIYCRVAAGEFRNQLRKKIDTRPVDM